VGCECQWMWGVKVNGCAALKASVFGSVKANGCAAVKASVCVCVCVKGSGCAGVKASGCGM
jgi:hypothetical protein